MRVAIATTLSLTLLASAPVAAMEWSAAAAAHGGHSGHGGHGSARGEAGYRLVDGAGAEVELWLPTLEHRPLSADADGGFGVKPSGFDSYHALVARRGGDTAVRYIVLRGKPSGHSPRDLLEAPKAPLEIVPDPYTREHQRYVTGSQVVFKVRLDGQPLGGQTVALATGNGTRLFANSDATGHVSFPLPEDFPHVRPGREDNRPVDFTASTVHGEQSFSLTAQYNVNPSHWQSSNTGVGTGLAGFAAGVVLLMAAGRPRRGEA